MADMNYLKIFSDMEVYFESYSMEARGRLITAMMDYCFHGTDPEFDGEERFIWPALKNHIDACASALDTARQNGQRGGRPPKQKPEEIQEEPEEQIDDSELEEKTEPNLTKPEETQLNPQKPKKTHRNPKKPPETQLNPPKPIHDHIHNHDQEQDQEQEQEQYITPDPLPPPQRADAREDDPEVTAFDGTDLRETLENSKWAQTVILRYKLPDGDPVREALLEDGEHYGRERVESALLRASQSNSRPGLSVNYYRKFLNDTGGGFYDSRGSGPGSSAAQGGQASGSHAAGLDARFAEL